MVVVSYFVHYDPLLQNATVHYYPLLQNATDIITKCDSYCILLQNASGFLIAECDSFIKKTTHKLQWFCYKMRQLFRNGTLITKSVGTKIIKKMGWD